MTATPSTHAYRMAGTRYRVPAILYARVDLHDGRRRHTGASAVSVGSQDALPGTVKVLTQLT
ncbi:hypothetical protein GCM10010344_45260 [Streptomyces bluensis]|nr:hypothetical protein GCM10010344_45260 [Streptomyces bluensis]